MSFEDDAMDLFIDEKTVITMEEKLRKKHGNSDCCHGVEGDCNKKGKWRPRNTSYCEEELNWVFLCDKCFKIEEEFWREQWADYYSNCC